MGSGRPAESVADHAVLPVELRSVSKSFTGIKVLSGVSFDIRPGEVNALMGESGAGKSTLIKIMAGLHQADEGEILVNGKAARFSSPGDAHNARIPTVHQELLLFPELTVAENIFLGQTPKTSLGTIDWRTMRHRARELLDTLDSGDLDIDQKVATPASAEAVTQANKCGAISIFGFATPNARKPYVEKSCVKSVVLWNSVDLGCAAMHVLHSVADGTLQPGATSVKAGKLGDLQVINGSEILLGAPYVFNKENIGQFDF